MQPIHFWLLRRSAMMRPIGQHRPPQMRNIAMNKFGAIASLVAASAFASHLNAELYRNRDQAPAPVKAEQKPARH